jgi:preprotein translocase subunit SecG
MQSIIDGILAVVSPLLVVIVLLQDRGGELGGAFGGSGSFYRSRRGIEKLLFRATIVLATLFVCTSLVNTLIS